MTQTHRVTKTDSDRLYRDQVDRLNNLALNHGISKASLHRWCLDYALEAIEKGRVSPPQPEPDKAA